MIYCTYPLYCLFIVILYLSSILSVQCYTVLILYIVCPPATPTVYTIHPSTDDATPPVSLISVSPLTFSVPATFSGGSVLKCVARGFPVPHIRWVDSNGTSLTPMFVSRPFGMVEAILEWDSALLSGPVRCEVSNEFGNDSKSVNFAEGTVRITNTTITDPPATKSAITVRVKVDSTQCSVSDISIQNHITYSTSNLSSFHRLLSCQ